ncbi:hypothetical protein BOH66_06410 [Microbacterium aurum]|uniref:Phenylalanyl-tRNA synthetase subunit beta n=1 Tax=Microbacterium aurum TaxID=36805 RepID=A0A1P8U728_9MICO|nr:hypothetical protein BOH66_06410 [Microbacterium aurum]
MHWRRWRSQARTRIAATGPLQSLTIAELRLSEQPLTIDPHPHRRVRAWVRFGETPARVEAIVARWTPDAVGIRFTIGGASHRCWVWLGAVETI